MKKILIVEDEHAYLNLLQTQLTENGYEVITASNGKEGLEKTKSEHPDLVLLDIRLPQIDGMTVLNLLRTDEATKSTKVIMLTNLEPDDKIINDVVKNEPSYYFVKSDIKFNDLLEKISNILKD